MVYLTRRYRFAAAHRLHSPALSPEENARVYGKCNNPYGHGHNYILEVTVAGEVDLATGMVYDVATLDRMVEQDVIERFDHLHLNTDVDAFRNLVPTTENLCIEIYNLLQATLKANGQPGSARLDRVRLEETNSNSFEYSGAGAERKAEKR
jgi:6-pyruvoyltetrahydropterin/6-carboxytetrahydropterin synthase